MEVRPPRHVATHVTFPLGVTEDSTRINIKPIDSNVPVGNYTNALMESALADHVISASGDGEFQVVCVNMTTLFFLKPKIQWQLWRLNKQV